MTGIEQPPSYDKTMDYYVPAVTHLSAVDPVMKRLITEIGPCTLQPRIGRSPFESLARAIAYQQLHDKAAESILARFRALFPGNRFPRPGELLRINEDRIRAAGFSRLKVMALRDLAQKTLDGTVPTNRAAGKMEDGKIVERLIQVRGIGPWTVEMLLIFTLGRPDVLPIDDFGVRNGFRIAYKKREMPGPDAMRRHGERWKPYRTVASWYLWRAVDQAKDGARAVSASSRRRKSQPCHP